MGERKWKESAKKNAKKIFNILSLFHLLVIKEVVCAFTIFVFFSSSACTSSSIPRVHCRQHQATKYWCHAWEKITQQNETINEKNAAVNLFEYRISVGKLIFIFFYHFDKIFLFGYRIIMDLITWAEKNERKKPNIKLAMCTQTKPKWHSDSNSIHSSVLFCLWLSLC